MRCANCGGEVSRGSRFCPHCSAPQPEGSDTSGLAEPAAPLLAEGRPELAPEPVPRRWTASYPFALLVFLAAAIVAFAVLAIALGWLTQDVFGL